MQLMYRFQAKKNRAWLCVCLVNTVHCGQAYSVCVSAKWSKCLIFNWLNESREWEREKRTSNTTTKKRHQITTRSRFTMEALIKYSRAIQCKQHLDWLSCTMRAEQKKLRKIGTYIHHCRIQNWTLINIVNGITRTLYMGMERPPSPLSLTIHHMLLTSSMPVDFYSRHWHLDACCTHKMWSRILTKWPTEEQRRIITTVQTKEFWFCTERQKYPK